MSVPPTSQLTLLPTEFVYEGAEYIFGEPFFFHSLSLSCAHTRTSHWNGYTAFRRRVSCILLFLIFFFQIRFFLNGKKKTKTIYIATT